MRGLRRPLKRPVEFDLEGPTQLFGHQEVFVIRGKQHIMTVFLIAVLPQLDRMPAIGLLEARESNIHIHLFGSKKAFESLGKPISEHLYCGGRNMFFLSLESLLKLVLGRKGPVLSVLCFDHLQHSVVQNTGLNQALHEQMVLLLIDEQAILKRSHVFHYSK